MPIETLKAVTINISKSGLSLYAFAPLSQGQSIVLKCRLPVEHRLCTILWVKQENESMYKMGLKFVLGRVQPEERPGIGVA